jgi:hypothetical protein
MNISYAITVHNEHFEFKRLTNLLLKYLGPNDEIVILQDIQSDINIEEMDFETVETLKHIAVLTNDPNVCLRIKYRKIKFDGDFSKLKNTLISLCKNEYIFHFDADEYPNENLLINLKEQIIQANPSCEMFWVPRINTVKGITKRHIAMWGWNVNDKGWINYPDYQQRLWKNVPNIQFTGKVHERLIGANTFMILPAFEIYSIYHPKDIKKQESQNKLYSQLQETK